MLLGEKVVRTAFDVISRGGWLVPHPAASFSTESVSQGAGKGLNQNPSPHALGLQLSSLLPNAPHLRGLRPAVSSGGWP